MALEKVHADPVTAVTPFTAYQPTESARAAPALPLAYAFLLGARLFTTGNLASVRQATSICEWGPTGKLVLATLSPVYRAFGGYKTPSTTPGQKFLTPGVSLNQSMTDPNFIGRTQDRLKRR